MAIQRDSTRQLYTNTNDAYEEILEGRNVPFIQHFGTKRLQYPSTTEMASLNIENHYWKMEDRYWKLASAHYDDPMAWWIIGWFNQKPTEAHVKTGDLIMIPKPLESLYRILGI